MLSYAIVSSLDTLFNILVWLVLIRVIMSWFRPRPMSSGAEMFYRVYRVLHQLTEPLLAPIRQVMPGGAMGMDFSPLILLLVLQFLRQMIRGLI